MREQPRARYSCDPERLGRMRVYVSCPESQQRDSPSPPRGAGVMVTQRRGNSLPAANGKVLHQL
jgi:hypothetical protein